MGPSIRVRLAVLLTVACSTFGCISRGPEFPPEFGAPRVKAVPLTIVLHLDSREYTLPLAAGRFAREKKGAEAFLTEVKAVAADLGITFRKGWSREVRTIRFLDTPDHAFRTAGYVLRLRRARDSDKTRVTLEYRSPVRSDVTTGRMSCTEADFDRKFEEEVTPNGPRFSISATYETSTTGLEDVEEAVGKFPVLSRADTDDDDELNAVNGHLILEHELEGKTFEIADVEAGWALTLWYADLGHGAAGAAPVVAEFSFACGIPKGGNRDADAGFGEFYAALRTRLAGWIDPDGKPNASFVYEGR